MFVSYQLLFLMKYQTEIQIPEKNRIFPNTLRFLDCGIKTEINIHALSLLVLLLIIVSLYFFVPLLKSHIHTTIIK